MSRKLETEDDRKVMFGLCIRKKILRQLDEKREKISREQNLPVIPRSSLVEKLIVEYLAKS